MACSRCEERRKALLKAAANASKGDFQRVKTNLSFVGRTAVEDARIAASRRMAAFRSR